ncbi:hypothetical protein [Flavobacterium branchiophilum]|uniref:Uncharacterized protein n=1 Tax=Flavobacterium branchiophilum TaxID=55197 RepID=A0A543G6N3_9FLAO|nr:hypothetical protein [Flavobacterium branchiophilum]TQM41624.1 hypothetical protein BC670_2611 [Flavobacterium branchiophilum]GEM55301.1 hypothetical protein FB1_15220 [Flavobacterium branchiophilum NBRC 15030 = ATCC 35035]
MKSNYLLYVIILLTFTNIFSQTDEKKINGVTIRNTNQIDTTKIKINSTFLLLGTLNDYMSYNYGSLENKFDRYYTTEKPLMKFVDSIVKKDFKINLIEDKNCFISKEMSNLMNSFYIKNNLNDSLFNSNEKKLSFLLGVYYRNGEKINDRIYKIQLANSPKHNNVYEFLKELNCQNIFFTRLDNIPTIYQIYFQPTEIIKKYFATIEIEKEKLFTSKIESLSLIKITKEEYKKEMEKENLEIIKLFSKK